MSVKALDYERVLPPVDLDHGEIRILEVHPGDWGNPIRCIFQTSKLDGLQQSYTALSYAWGNTSVAPHHEIFIDDTKVSVTETIAGALQRLRRKDEPIYVWLDALCINQGDNDEKSHQVSMMHRIYTECDQCAIWLDSLGETSHADAEAAFEILAWIAGESGQPGWLNDGQTRNTAATALKTLLGLPWWSRIWTVQEAILPHRGTVYWGPCELGWQTLHAAADALFNNTAPRTPYEFWRNNSLLDLQHVMRGLKYSQKEPLFLMLWRWRFRRATDPRDKVFGVLGFRSDISLPTVKICDYSKDTKTIYQQVTADLIRESGNLSPLIGRGGEGSDIPGLASWAVDWVGVQDESKRSASDFWEHFHQWNGLGYTADRGLYGVGDGLRMINESTLCLRGLRIDRIALVEVQDSVSHEDSAEKIFSIHGDRWGELITRFQSLHPDSLPKNWMSSFLGLITGKLIPGNPHHGDDLNRWTRQMLRPQVVFITESGKFGVGPRKIQPGQELWLLGGSRLPVVLTPQNNSDSSNPGLDFSFVGECFVYGIMMGEAVVGSEEQQKDIHLH